MKLILSIIYLLVIVSMTHAAYANPIGPYDLLYNPLPLATILLTCALAFIVEFKILRWMLGKYLNLNTGNLIRHFIRANIISFPIAWGIYLGLPVAIARLFKVGSGILGISIFFISVLLAEVAAIVIEKKLYNRWLQLPRGDRPWWCIVAANLASWIGGIVIGGVLAITAHEISGIWAIQSGSLGYKECLRAHPVQASNDLGWIKSDNIIYRYEKNSQLLSMKPAYDKLLRIEFNPPRTTVISPHARVGRLLLTPDGRFLVIQSALSPNPEVSIYDVAKKKVIQLSSFPIDPFNTAGFSPDGKHLAWLSDSPPKIVVADIEKAKFTTTSFPSEWDMSRAYSADGHWSADGKYIYINFKKTGLVGEDIDWNYRFYFRFELATRRITKIEGRFEVMDNMPPSYLDNGEVAKLAICNALSGCKPYGAPRDLGFKIKSDNRLYMTTTDGREIETVSTFCYHRSPASLLRAPPPLWLEDGKYLLFEVQDKSYIYGVAEKRTSLLFDFSMHNFIIGKTPSLRH